MNEVPNNLAVFTLPAGYIPGSDVISEFLLRDRRVMDIVIKSLVGDHALSSMYNLEQCQWPNRSISDMLCLPKTQDLVPILIEIQYEVNEDFIGRVMNYSLSLKNEYGQLLIVLVIATESVTNNVSSKLIGPNDYYMDNIRCDFWAKKCVILSSNSIKPHLEKDPLQKLVAFGHFLTQKKRYILSIDKKHDATIQLLYQIEKDKFQNECQVEEEKLMVIQDLCYKGSRQFRKIADCAKNGDSMDKIFQYALDGEHFFTSQERKFSSQCIETTPIEDTPDVSDLSISSYQSSFVYMDDETFVENFMSKLTGRMNWNNCYNQGKENGFFTNYNNWKSLKTAYNSRKSRIQKRKRVVIEE